MIGRRAFAGFLALMMCGACASTPLRARVPTTRLAIENPGRHSLTLERVGGGHLGLGTDERVEITLEAARYVVLGDGLAVPAPLVHGDAAPMVVLVERRGDVPRGFALIPGGPTLIGDTLGVGAPDERPVRIVEVAAFFIAERETTNAQYAEFLNGVEEPDDGWLDVGGPKCLIRRDASGTYVTDAPALPVVTVSYSGATAYCDWRTRATGRVHRLPSEIEWERMARGPMSSVYSYGDVYEPSAANQESGRLLPTASFPATGWGVYDATGNAFEWTSSDYEPGLKVLKGGSYILDGLYLRNAFRMWYRPHVLADDIGFRVLLEIDG